jgi:atypical dual specificity phosphatase
MNALDWLLPDAVAACVYPDVERGLPGVACLGITVLVNLHERPHDTAALARHGLRQVHLPVRDFTPPAPEQIEAGIEAIEAAVAAGQRVAVHCAAGLGRTGTLLACYLVRQGMDPDAAIARIRALRPGSVETPEQVAAVHAYARRLGPL